jgi:hypothetical protein
MALTATQKQMIAKASEQPTLGAQLVVAGVEQCPANKDALAAVKQIWYNWTDDHPEQLDVNVYNCVQAALDGYKDDTIVPDAWEGPTIQSVTKSDVSLEDALDQVANYDKGAADVLADACHRAQANAPEYSSQFLKRFAKHAWRGAKKAIEIIGGAAGAAVKGLATGLGWEGFLLVGAVVSIYALARGGGSSRVTHENPRRFLGPLR